jgi:transcriptional regulator
MYTPSHFNQQDLAAIHELIEGVGFASIVTVTADGLTATQAPVLFDSTRGDHGILRGHIARANAQWKSSLASHEALAIITGANGYVSPNYYASKREHGRVVPTWNYVAVHAHGAIEFSEDRGGLLDIVTRLTDKHERNSEHPWKVTDAPADYIEAMLKAIIAFELRITRIEANWKLSQNKTDADRAGVIAGMEARGSEVLEEMRKLYKS